LAVVTSLVSLGMPQQQQQQLEMEKYTRELKPYMDQLVQKNTLKYQQSCDYNIELERQRQSKELINLISNIGKNIQNFNPDRFKNDLTRIVRSMAEVRGTFCNGYSNLQCNSTGLCVCADADESLGFKLTFVREGDSCRVAEGSICASQETIDKSRLNNPLLSEAPRQEMKCANNRHCIVKSNRKGCSTEAMQEEFQRMAKEQGRLTPATLMEFIIQKTKDGICVCKGASAAASTLLVLISAIFITAKSVL